MLANTNTVRIQVVLNESQKEFLSQTADREGTNISALIRKLVDQYEQMQKEARLELAVRELKSEYETNEELTAFTALDGDDFE